MAWSWAADGFDHYFTLSAGASPPDGGPITIVCLLRPTSNFVGPIRGLAGGSASYSIHSDSGKWFTDNDFSAGFGFALNSYQVVALSKAAGSAAVRWHQTTESGGTYGAWSHANGPTIGDGSNPVDAITIGLSYQRMAGQIAAIALWTSALSDGAVEALGTSAMATWLAAGPSAAWQFNAAPALGITDLTGGGANSTSLTGTAPTLDTTNEPPGWTYAGGSIVVNIGQAVTTATAQPVGRLKAVTLGQALGLHAAQPVGRLKTYSLGLAGEADTATAISRLKLRSIGQPATTSTAQPVGRVKAVHIGRATETDAAIALQRTAATTPDYARRVTARQATNRVTARTGAARVTARP
jgi:hypothetical protein